MPAEKLWVTVYAEDDEAFDIWEKEVGVPRERIVRIGDNKGARYASDNFWQMADTGPVRPLFRDFLRPWAGSLGRAAGSAEQDGDRYIEIWNLVFMQFDRDAAGNLNPLPKPCVDTGMGWSVWPPFCSMCTAIMKLICFRLDSGAARETGVSDLALPSLRVIADHIRACAFLIVDGIIPGNEGRGYVLRRIIRRALRHGHKLGQTQPFFHNLVADLDAVMGEAYPELRRRRRRVAEVLKQEEERFGETLATAWRFWKPRLAGGVKQLDGETAFRLYDTFGFPLDLTADVCRERGI